MPAGVVMPILPVFAPVGTVAVTCILEFTVNVVALIPPNVTFDAPFRPPPVITTETPTFPLVGLKLRMLGKTMKILLLVRVLPGVTTVTIPVVAALGTVTSVKKVSDITVKLAEAPLKETPVVPVNPCPRIPTFVPIVPTEGSTPTKGFRFGSDQM